MSDLPLEYQMIQDEIMPKVMERFLTKAGDYGDAWKLLGAKGQFSDINRKFWKLYRSIWEDKELQGEQPAECAEDIIGHCLILLWIFHQEGGGEPTPLGAEFSAPERLVPPTLRASRPVGYPEAEEVVEAIRRAAAGGSRNGMALGRIIDEVMSLYGRKEHGVK
jgi:hypothetical protein